MRRIAVNAVASGIIKLTVGRHSAQQPEVYRHIADATALWRPDLSDDIGTMIAALAAEDSRWVIAQRIHASGGQAI